MASTQVAQGADIAQQSWRAGLIHEAERQAHMMGFVTSEDDAGLILLDEPTKERGDLVQVRFSPTDDSHDGFSEGETAEGKEQSIDVFYDELRIGYLREVFAVKGTMSQQRVNFDLKKTSFIKASAWWARRWEESILNQLAGYLPAATAPYKRTGMNDVTAIDANHYVYPASFTAAHNAGEDENIDSSDELDLRTIQSAALHCMTKSELDYPIAPCPDGFYHLIIHPHQWDQLRANTSPGEWEDLTRAQIEGGKKWEGSQFARGWLGTYTNVKIHVSDYVPKGVHSSTDATVENVRRAVMIGACAGCMSFGEGYASEGHLNWVEQTRDYGEVWGVQADSVFGFKRTIFDGQTYGAIVLPTYSAG